MNVERLHAIAAAVRNDLATSSLFSVVQQLAAGLQNQVNNPSEATYQHQVAQALTQVRPILRNSAVNDFMPTWVQVLEEIGAADLLGDRLAERIEDIFNRNQITPSLANAEMQGIVTGLQSLIGALDQIVAAFNYLKLGAEVLEPGECEVGVLIPRAFVDNRLDKFADELSELNKIFGVFSEIAGEGRGSFEIRTIASSELSIFLDCAPLVALLISETVEKVLNAYKTLLEIRKIQGELEKQGVDEASLQGLKDHANNRMNAEIDVISTDAVTEFYKGEKTRTTEITTELRISLKNIANRVDRGFNIEVRMAEPFDVSEGDDAGATKAADQYARIKSAAATLQYLKVDGNPILSLTEQDPAKPIPARPGSGNKG